MVVRIVKTDGSVALKNMYKGEGIYFVDENVQYTLTSVISRPTRTKSGNCILTCRNISKNTEYEVKAAIEPIKYTRREIENTLRGDIDTTKVWKMVKKLYGHADYENVGDFVRENAPSHKGYDRYYGIAHPKKHELMRLKCERLPMFDKHRIVEYMKKEKEEPLTNYTKFPMIVNRKEYIDGLWVCAPWLSFCSPKYGSNDYNKWYALKYEGNEKFCDTVIRWWKKNGYKYVNNNEYGFN